MDGPVIELRLVGQVRGDHLPDAGVSVREAPPFGCAAFPLQKGQQPGALRRLAAPVQPLQDYERAAAALAAAVIHPRTLERGPALREQAEATRSRDAGAPGTGSGGRLSPVDGGGGADGERKGRDEGRVGGGSKRY